MRAARAMHRDELLRRQRDEDRERKRDADASADAADLMDAAMMLITASDADAFRVELDRYDTATVAALQLNGEALDAVQERMEKLLAKAYVLPDGRRIFKTEDGTRVFDEFGAELGRDEIDPAMIEDARPSWETYKPELDEKNRLLAERREILAYQEKLDNARERLDSGEMTQGEYERLRDDLKVGMPEAVQAQIDGIERQPDQSPTAEADLVFEEDMVPTGQAASRAFAPS